MRWGDIAHENGIWHKREIKSVGEKVSRAQFLELSQEALRLLQSLPRCGIAGQDELVFPNDADSKLGNWTRITRVLQRESGTNGWHRHDLRRTAASIMRAVGLTEAVIDEVLGHKAASSRESLSAALANYLVPMEIQMDLPHPRRDALDLLARTLSIFESWERPS